MHSNSIDNYIIKKKIGEGTYGTVYLAEDTETHEQVALKKVKTPPSTMDSIGIHFSTIREISILQELNHPNIVKIHRIGLNANQLYIAYELMPSDLSKIIRSRSVLLTPAMVKTYVRTILHTLAYLHSHFVLHRVC